MKGKESCLKSHENRAMKVERFSRELKKDKWDRLIQSCHFQDIFECLLLNKAKKYSFLRTVQKRIGNITRGKQIRHVLEHLIQAEIYA